MAKHKCPSCGCRFETATKRKAKADLSDEAVILRTSRAVYVPLGTVLARLIGGTFNVPAPSPRCVYCRTEIDRSNHTNVCIDCAEPFAEINARAATVAAINARSAAA